MTTIRALRGKHMFETVFYSTVWLKFEHMGDGVLRFEPQTVHAFSYDRYGARTAERAGAHRGLLPTPAETNWVGDMPDVSFDAVIVASPFLEPIARRSLLGTAAMSVALTRNGGGWVKHLGPYPSATHAVVIAGQPTPGSVLALYPFFRQSNVRDDDVSGVQIDVHRRFELEFPHYGEFAARDISLDSPLDGPRLRFVVSLAKTRAETEDPTSGGPRTPPPTNLCPSCGRCFFTRKGHQCDPNI